MQPLSNLWRITRLNLEFLFFPIQSNQRVHFLLKLSLAVVYKIRSNAIKLCKYTATKKKNNNNKMNVTKEN